MWSALAKRLQGLSLALSSFPDPSLSYKTVYSLLRISHFLKTGMQLPQPHLCLSAACNECTEMSWTVVLEYITSSGIAPRTVPILFERISDISANPSFIDFNSEHNSQYSMWQLQGATMIRKLDLDVHTTCVCINRTCIFMNRVIRKRKHNPDII